LATKSKKFESVIINLKTVGFSELIAEIVDRTAVNRERLTTIKTVEMMFVRRHNAIDGFAIGQG
jgi:hypothetical protein